MPARRVWPPVLAGWAAPEIGRGALDRREAPHLPSARSRPKTLCKFPLSDKNSLLSLQKFPARLRREFSCKPLNLRAEFVSESLAGAEIGKNSRRFPEILGPKDRFGENCTLPLVVVIAFDDKIVGFAPRVRDPCIGPLASLLFPAIPATPPCSLLGVAAV
jgi:hypothetical protein